MSGGKYTWSNNQVEPTLEKLDRILVNNKWDARFPLSTVRKILRFVVTPENSITIKYC
jgi:hypothetical protein